MTSVPLSKAKQAIDFSRKFIPEQLTPLFHTPAYQRLNEAQRLCYNQLHALYFNEQTMFFEKSFARTLLVSVLSEPLPADLKTGLQQFIEEEERHSEMFRQLNLKCAPKLYAKGDFHFIRVPSFARMILGMISRHPKIFPAFLWLMHLQEESALFYGKTYLQSTDGLEPHFLEIQRLHLADEVGHVRWDQSLIDWFWPRTNIFLRKLNVSFLAWMIGEYFSAPKRAGLRVIDALVNERPELRPQHYYLRQQLLGLEYDPVYRSWFYSPKNVPETLKRFDQWPEFHVLQRVMPGYIPRERLPA